MRTTTEVKAPLSASSWTLCVPEEIYAIAVDPLESVLLLALLVAVAVVAAERLRVHAFETRTLYAKSER